MTKHPIRPPNPSEGYGDIISGGHPIYGGAGLFIGGAGLIIGGGESA